MWVLYGHTNDLFSYAKEVHIRFILYLGKFPVLNNIVQWFPKFLSVLIHANIPLQEIYI